MPYDIIGEDEYVGLDFTGADHDDHHGYDEVDQILGALDIVGARRGSSGRAGRHSGPPSRRGGAGRHSSSQMQRQDMNAALAAKRAKAGLLFEQQQPGACRRLTLGMSSTGTVAAGAIAQITARPQNLAFKPQRIVVPATIAPDFLITDIKVGNVSQVVQSSVLPAEAFTQGLFDGMMEMDTVQTSQDFVLSVQNIAGAARNFYAAVYGLALLAR